MPPAKKPTAAKPASRVGAASAASRREMERAIKRFEKSIEDANGALQSLASGASKDAKGGYRELSKSLTAVRRDAQKHNANLIKEFDKVKGAVSSRTRSAGNSAAAAKKSSSATTNAKSTTAAKRAPRNGRS